jgi:hypothetical protein
MKYLVFCSCGHSLEDHESEGCAHAAGGPCACRRDPSAALDAAIERAKTDGLATWRAADQPSDIINV